MRSRLYGLALSMSLVACSGCGLVQSGAKTTETTREQAPRKRKVVVELPWETTKGRDDLNSPVLHVVVLDDGADGVPVPYLYGYPLYGEGDAVRGVLQLRHDNREGAMRETREDENGVVHVREVLPQLGCTIEGIAESETQFVPLELRCDVPPPKALGGSKRPVVGELRAGASPDAIAAEPSLNKAFFGGYHLESGSPDKGKGEGLFNTDHGQIGFVFERGKLVQIAYYFDPPVQSWRDPALWAEL